jgi:acetyl esterase/lipase
VLGDLDSDDPICRDLCARSDAIVVSVNYRHAPAARFPAAADDGFAAVRWIAANPHALGAEPGRLAVCGWSAGGNVAAVVCQMARDAGGPHVGQVLPTDRANRTEPSPAPQTRPCVGPPYTPSRPADSVLHQVVRTHLETFLAEARARGDGDGLPPHPRSPSAFPLPSPRLCRPGLQRSRTQFRPSSSTDTAALALLGRFLDIPASVRLASAANRRRSVPSYF